MRRRARLALEPLEDRAVPATFGVPWSDPTHLTISFAPDGTPVAGQPSSLFATLGDRMSAAAWQEALLRGFQTWAALANLNFAVAADTGLAFGTAGRVQADGRFGDVRVGAQPLSRDVLSVSVPHDPFLAGSWAGDVFLNSTHAFTPTALFATALHEAGHVLGLGHSDDPTSAMYSHLNSQTSPTADDVRALQALYGRRVADRWEGERGNATFATATRVEYPTSKLAVPVVVFGDVTTGGDVDTYALRTPSGYAGPVTFRVQSAGLSLLEARLTVYDGRGNVVGTAASFNPAGDVISVRVAQAAAESVYYLRVEAVVDDVFGVGRYGLVTTFDARRTTPEARLQAVLRGPYDGLDPEDVHELLADEDALVDDDAEDDDPGEAVRLASTPGHAPNTHYDVVASLSGGGDSDYYRIRTARAAAGQSNVLTATAVALSPGREAPRLRVLDELGAEVPSRVLTNGNGTFTIQVADAASNANYYVRVEAATAQAAGNYDLAIGFTRQAAAVRPFAVNTLTAAAPRQDYQVYVAHSQLFRFALTATAGAVRVTLSDAAGVPRMTLTAAAGETVTANGLFLAPGAYTVRVTAVGTAPPSPLGYTLSGVSLGEPIGPGLLDPTLVPQYRSLTDPSLFAYPGEVIWPEPFFFVLLDPQGTIVVPSLSGPGLISGYPVGALGTPIVRGL